MWEVWKAERQEDAGGHEKQRVEERGEELAVVERGGEEPHGSFSGCGGDETEEESSKNYLHTGVTDHEGMNQLNRGL